MSEQTALRMGTAQGRWVLFATVLGSGLAMLDATVVNIALGSIGEDFDASFADLQWTVNAYTLTLASLILLGGSLGDRFGRRRVFLVGVLWFAAASMLCGLARNVETLIAARALQGVGGALLTPGSLAIISAAFHGGDRARAVGTWSGLGGIAGAIGPFVGGWLLEWSWRAVFLVNLPAAALVVVVAVKHVPESSDASASRRFDAAGIALAVLGLGALTWSLTAAGDAGASASVIAFGVVGVLAMVAFVAVEHRSSHPMLPTGLFADARFRIANAATFFVYAAIGVIFVLLVLQLQNSAGFSPVLAGSALLPVTVIMVLFSARGGALAQRIGPRIPMTVGPLIAAVSVLLMSRIGPDATYAVDVLVPLTLFGVGLALTVAPLTATVLDGAPDRYAGVASGVNNAIARAAGLLAIAVVPALAGLSGEDYVDPAALTDGFRAAMFIAAGLLALGGVLAGVFLKPVASDVAEPAGR